VAAAARVREVVEGEWGAGLIRSWNTAGWITLSQPSATRLRGWLAPARPHTTLKYNAAGRPISITDPLGNEISLTYELCLLSSVTDPLTGRFTRSQWSALPLRRTDRFRRGYGGLPKRHAKAEVPPSNRTQSTSGQPPAAITFTGSPGRLTPAFSQ
jgi:YD repeat-containing protein